MPRVSSTLPTEADARRCLAAIDASGMSFYAWCGANKIPPSTLERWRQWLTGPPAKIAMRESVPRLVDVVVRPAAVPSRRSTVLPITPKRGIPPTTAQVNRPERSSRAVPALAYFGTRSLALRWARSLASFSR